MCDVQFKEIFNKWGTFQSLQKDAQLVKYFLARPETDVRQKTIIEHFKGEMSAKTVREHLKKLVKKGILDENPLYRGTYVFVPSNYRRMGVDMDKLVRAIVGEDIYELARAIWLEKNKPRESESKDHRNPVYDVIDKEVEQYEQELDEYARGFY